MAYIPNNKKYRAVRSRPVAIIRKTREAAEKEAKKEAAFNKKVGINGVDTYVAKIPQSWKSPFSGQWGVFSKEADKKTDQRRRGKFNAKRRKK
jgi:hypothetical protein